jgi:hypothetical protein
VAHESPKVAYERRLVALEAISQLCRIPGKSGINKKFIFWKNRKFPFFFLKYRLSDGALLELRL